MGRPNHRRNPDAGFKWFVQNYKKSAAQRGFAFALSDEEMRDISSRECHYCGAPPSRVSRRGCHAPYVYNGIDRVDTERGYVPGNVVTCCFECNVMKGTLDVGKFLARVRAIAARL